MSSPPSEDHDNGLADVEPGIFQDAPDDANFADYLGPAAEEPRSSPLPDSDQQEGRPCDKHGNFLPDGTPPLPAEPRSCNDWTPLRNCVEFETAEFLYIQNQMSANQADRLLNLWATTLLKHGDSPPFADHCDLYATINSIPLGGGGVKWQGLSCTYSDEKPDGNYPPWMDGSYDVWYRDPQEVVCNMLANPAYSDEMDYRPYREYSTDGDEHQFRDFMSADWAWDQADIITGDPETLGSMFVPIILVSDKTTVSVATGNNEYYPLYLSIGNVHNNFNYLAMKEYAEDPKFRAFRRQLFHSLLSRILETLRPGMTKPEVAKFGDGHFRWVIYGLGPYIADYEEQVLLACIVSHWCLRCCAHRKDLDAGALLRCHDHTEALVDTGTYTQLWFEFGIISNLVVTDIYHLIAPDLLHQVIKGAFKDHLMAWVELYIMKTHGKRDGLHILDDIDHRIVAVASFAGLRHFPQGRGFKQWTGDDSKALMKVYLAAIEGHVLQDIVRVFRAFLEFCYLIHRNTITESTLEEIEDALSRYHHYRTIFTESGTIPTFSLPRQHSLVHYTYLIQRFGAPNGLCSSITESKHIKAIKEPWRHSSKYKALGQMLVTNQHLDKLAAARVDFANCGMLDNTCLVAELEALDTDSNNNPNVQVYPLPSSVANEAPVAVDHGLTILQAHTRLAQTVLCSSTKALCDAERKHARNVLALAKELELPCFPDLIHQFLFEQTHRPDDDQDPAEIPLAGCPRFAGKISVFNSASSRFYTPSDISGIGGMRVEHIRACPLWRNEAPRNDCIFVNTGSSTEGMRGLEVARVRAFFSFKYSGENFPCAIVRWFDVIGDSPDEDTGMWMVCPAYSTNHAPLHSIIHVDTIYRAAHLIPIYGRHFLPPNVNLHVSYDSFWAYYVNKFIDHHAFEIAS
ncbi:uncharacterized protein EDB91DRAFT_1241042 [Suillus paluster]|uniref:uncharacterized protein n=1 Tax=Suillus paluster TaxID=48578 RepID=UPI001B87182F|nr:uncharacterized protein EDB91DRAFT_1241042 [Suillus paluster]KAG1717847.1 hypothetical protein EDB91DRAFT_1241042 [Suillus paluster]